MPTLLPAILSILVVDDEPIILELLDRFLREQGHQVGLASSGEEALRLFQEAPCEFVLTDRNMPGMDGEALASAIKLLSPRTAVVLMSGMLPPLVVPAIDGVLHKPFTTDVLMRMIAACCFTVPPVPQAASRAG